MGKVHRIKKAFWRTVSTVPWQTLSSGSAKSYSLARVLSITAGKRYDGSCYVFYYGNEYKALMRTLLQAYNAGVALRDKTPTKG